MARKIPFGTTHMFADRFTTSMDYLRVIPGGDNPRVLIFDGYDWVGSVLTMADITEHNDVIEVAARYSEGFQERY